MQKKWWAIRKNHAINHRSFTDNCFYVPGIPAQQMAAAGNKTPAIFHPAAFIFPCHLPRYFFNFLHDGFCNYKTVSR
jgi:hypothetical protein